MTLLPRRAAMAVGAIGPWAKVPGYVFTVYGLEYGNRGWVFIVLAIAAAAVLVAARQRSSSRLAWALPAIGLAGAVVAVLERRRLGDEIGITETDESGNETGIPFEVMWGLDLELIASLGLVVTGALVIRTGRTTEPPEPDATPPAG